MKTNLRGKIREFIASEEGRVGVKGPLTLGVATGSVLLAQAIIGNPAEARTCTNNTNALRKMTKDSSTSQQSTVSKKKK